MPAICAAQFRIDTSRNVNYLAIPVLFKTPETGWAYGLSASANFKTSFKNDSLTRMSSVTLLGIFSERQQNIQGLDATIYFPKEKYILYVQTSHSYFPDNFWGIGQNTKSSNLEKYVFEQIVVNPHLKRKFFKHVFFKVFLEEEHDVCIYIKKK